MDAYTAFKDFIFARLNRSQSRLENNPQYNKNMDELNRASESAIEAGYGIKTLAEEYAYLQGFQDGLSIMAGLGFSE